MLVGRSLKGKWVFLFLNLGMEMRVREFFKGARLFDGRLIVRRRWSEHMGLERDFLSTIPVWVHFPSLNLKLWSKSVIGRIANMVGKPLYMDRAMTNGGRGFRMHEYLLR